MRLIKHDKEWTKIVTLFVARIAGREWEGIVSRATYKGDFAPFWRFLRFGQFVHLGHGTTFGPGSYELKTCGLN
jgi:hypothetical protein